jgi:hypothetical protein
MGGGKPEIGGPLAALAVVVDGRCRVCGCIDVRPCRIPSPDGAAQPCWWVEPDLCSGCEETPRKV